MHPPILVTPPAGPVVQLSALKEHLRVDHDDEDALITALEVAAVAHLDGWRGILGRAILSQTWSQDFDEWGDLPLLLPDVSSVTVIGILGEVETAATTVELIHNMGGSYVKADGGAASTVRVTYVVGLPGEQLAAVQMAVKLLVGHWYENREAATQTALSEAPMAVQALIAPLRRVLV